MRSQHKINRGLRKRGSVDENKLEKAVSSCCMNVIPLMAQTKHSSCHPRRNCLLSELSRSLIWLKCVQNCISIHLREWRTISTATEEEKFDWVQEKTVKFVIINLRG